MEIHARNVDLAPAAVVLMVVAMLLIFYDFPFRFLAFSVRFQNRISFSSMRFDNGMAAHSLCLCVCAYLYDSLELRNHFNLAKIIKTDFQFT